MNINFPSEPVYWIISDNYRYENGITMSDQNTTFGPNWTIILQTTDKNLWLNKINELGITNILLDI